MSAEPNTPAAIEFLQRWATEGPWVLTAITPDRKSIQTKTFTSRSLKAMSKWIDGFNGERNLYFHVNPCTRELSKKAEREDVAALAWLHVDIDPRVGEDIEEERARALGLLTDNLPRGVPPPTVVIFSGGGYQGFWRLEDPFPVDGDLARAEEAKRWNLQLELLFGADNCHNVDRIMRLPGTVNIPDKKKLEKGRTRVTAELVEFHDDRVYPLSDFTPAPEVQSPGTAGFGPSPDVKITGEVERLESVEALDQWKVPDRVKVIIVQGRIPDEPKEGDDSRSAWLFDCVCQLVRHEVPDEVIYSVITDPDFGISESVLDKGANTEKYALKQISSAKEFAIDPELQRMNDQFAVIGNLGGKCRVVEEVVDTVLGRSRLTMQSFGDFQNRHMNQRVEVVTENAKGEQKVSLVPLGKWWLQHTKRRQFEHLVFAPGKEVPGSYNLWKGFAYAARPGDCSLFLDHLRDNICAGVEDHFLYLMGWMARTVQRPASPGQVAVVMRGPKGSGKGFFASHFGRLFGRHYLQVSNPSHLVGTFNAHLRDCVVVFADEAFFAGDKKHESVLKTLITEDSITIEAKGVDAETAPNFVHLMLASNENWVVPATQGERRFFVLDVSPTRSRDVAYFRAVDQQMEAGGYEALLHHLLTYDLSDYEVRRVPDTAALQEQKELSLPPIGDWWLQNLIEGQLCGQAWPKRIPTLKLQESYLETAQAFGITRRGSATALGRFLREVCPGLRRVQLGPDRKWFYEVPSLGRARDAWEAVYGPREWPVVEQGDLPLDEDETPF